MSRCYSSRGKPITLAQIILWDSIPPAPPPPFSPLQPHPRQISSTELDRRSYSSVREWMYLTVCPLCGLSSTPSPGSGGIFRRSFPWLITLCQPVLSQQRKWPNLPQRPISNQWHKPLCHWSNHIQAMVEKNIGGVISFYCHYVCGFGQSPRGLSSRQLLKIS